MTNQAYEYKIIKCGVKLLSLSCNIISYFKTIDQLLSNIRLFSDENLIIVFYTSDELVSDDKRFVYKTVGESTRKSFFNFQNLTGLSEGEVLEIRNKLEKI